MAAGRALPPSSPTASVGGSRGRAEGGEGRDRRCAGLVGQMYYHGLRLRKNEPKAKAWISKVSKYRPSVWKVSKKRPGYNASDSDSDEVENDNNR
ncbi:uncharacterized protein A4U43_C05F4660 [Asparagus officinalis]|uniref:Uncharacterized protein n=1 Tax=Asparagus officinalis TaxID=4686 RepID=A0A5P1EUT6_ASPOF|nr:uncharacterized protein A4U43_C05F4660 [Asparagus officinalis]